MVLLTSLDDDTLICIFSFLTIPEIITMRQTCSRLAIISRLPNVWRTACVHRILHRGIPFPDTRIFPLESMSSTELETRVRHADRLARDWTALSSSSLAHGDAVIGQQHLAGAAQQKTFGTCNLRGMHTASASAVSEVKFVPNTDGRWVVTVSKGIWSVLSVWDVGGLHDLDEEDSRRSQMKKVAEWGPKGAIINGFVVNSEPVEGSEITLAVAVLKENVHSIHVLSLSFNEASRPILDEITTFDSTYRPLSLCGNILACSDEYAETVIRDWRRGVNIGVLRHPRDDEGVWQLDKPLEVVFVYQSVLVVRARSIHLFLLDTASTLELDPEHIPEAIAPIASHSFGWVDGVSVRVSKPQPNNHREDIPIYILIRAESDDPWAAARNDGHSLDLYALRPNPDYLPSMETSNTIQSALENTDLSSSSHQLPSANSPYMFPPTLVAQCPTCRGALRCTSIVLGAHRTAVWVRPKDRSRIGLVAHDILPPTTRKLLSGSTTDFYSTNQLGNYGLVVGSEDVFPAPDNSDYGEVTSQNRLISPDSGKSLSTLSTSLFAPSTVHETIVVAAFPIPNSLGLHIPEPGSSDDSVNQAVRATSVTRGVSTAVWTNGANDWTAIDYDEVAGRIVLGSAGGKVMLLEL